MSNFIKIRPVGAEFFHMGGKTVIPKVIVAFRNLANAKKGLKDLEAEGMSCVEVNLTIFPRN
jgi:hypothetical protein